MPNHPLKTCQIIPYLEMSQFPSYSAKMPERAYRPRVADAELVTLLEASGAVLVEGAKATGKTATAMQAAASHVLLDVDANARRLMAADPALLLAGATPRLIDEWQLEPSIWNLVRRAVDERATRGQFVLTGSAVPADDITRHTGAGRFTRLRLRPMSLFEMARSTGDISLRAILDGAAQCASKTDLSIATVAELIATGGWPANLGSSQQSAIRANRGYLDDIQRTDISVVTGQTRDPARVRRLCRSLARNVATPVSLTRLAADVSDADLAMKASTVAEYLDALERLMVVENLPAWSPHLRSRTTLRSSPVRHFVDPSLAVAALRSSPPALLADLQFLGLLFESLVIRDLRVYAQAADAEVFHYREKGGLEVDAVVETADGRWAAFEVKLGERWVAEGERNLKRLAARLADSPHGPPAALAVIVPSGYGYVGCDAEQVGVVPISALGP